MLEVAGRVGDGVIIECADRHYIAWALEHVRRGAEQAGRDPSRMAVISSTATYVSEDRRFARDQVRALGAIVGNHVAEVLTNSGPGSMPVELEAFVARRGDYDYRHHIVQGASHADYVPDDIVDRLCIVGTASECEHKLRALAELGVTHVNFYAQVDDFDEQMRTYGREIMPRLRAEAPR
jgi:alkanesulfonate monooxygenase SsuD/methylene tetrahydromethanopterin reductase-like flavin-dependent oxidoreductase (luciferase family)